LWNQRRIHNRSEVAQNRNKMGCSGAEMRLSDR
jgi:hypothetical protein